MLNYDAEQVLSGAARKFRASRVRNNDAWLVETETYDSIHVA
eukprot:COSAG01_NODE_46411_length_400_cov_1.308970_1_plen_41_part_10